MSTMLRTQLVLLGKRILENDKVQKEEFDKLSIWCKHRNLTKYAKNRPKIFACKSTLLKDPEFGWSCDMGNCPYLNGAMDWRANNV